MERKTLIGISESIIVDNYLTGSRIRREKVTLSSPRTYWRRTSVQSYFGGAPATFSGETVFGLEGVGLAAVSVFRGHRVTSSVHEKTRRSGLAGLVSESIHSENDFDQPEDVWMLGTV
jgi:hypothetical protein